MTTTTTNTNTNNATLAGRAASLMTKTTALGVVEKAVNQAISAKRVFPPMAQDFGEQIGHELPLKTRDFVRVVGHLLQASEKPLKGVISKKKADILAVLADLVGALTDTEAVQLPAWAVPKERAKVEKPEAETKAEASVTGALDKANALALAESNADKAEKAADMRLAQAIDLIVTNAATLTDAQRHILLSVLTAVEPALL